MTNWWEKDSVAVAENTPTVSTKNFWEKDSDLVEDLAGPEPQKRNIYAVGGMGGYDPGITKETAPQVNFGALSEKAGIPEIGTAIKEMISPTTQYTKKEADQAASELGKRIKLYGEYFTTLGGRIDLEALTAHVQAGEIGGTWAPSLPIDKEALKRPVIAGKKGRQALSEKAEELAGFGPALIPSAAELGQLAIEWGVVVPALFKASGATNEAVAQIPKVKKGLGALAKLGGIEKVAAKHPRLYDTVKGTLNAILKGSEVGTTMGALETVGEEMEPGEIIRHVGKEAVKMGLVAGAFHTASEVDTRIWTNTFRKNLLSSHRNRFDRLVYQIDRMGTGGDIKSAILKNMPSITPAELEAIGNISPNMRKAAAYKSLANKKTLELKAIDDVTAAAEAQLRAMKAGKIYREGQELIEDPVRAAKRISRSGLENVKTYPKGPAGLKKGLGKTEPFIEMPTTRTGEIRETITGKSRTSTKTPSGRRPPQSAAELGLEVGQKAITGFPKSDFLPTGVDQAIPPTRGGVQHPTGQVLPGGSAESTKLETAKQRAAERLSRKVTRAGTGRAEGPLIGQLYTHAEDLIEQAQAEQDPGKRKSLIDELEQTDSIVNQISRENLEGKSVEQLSKMAKRFGVEVPKGADKTAIIGLLAGKADLSQIQKTDSGYRIEIPIAATKAGRAMEVHEFDSYAEAAYFLEDREGEGGVTAAVSGPKPTQPTSTTKITTEKPTTETLVEPSDATQPVPMVGKGGIASPATVKPSPRASTEKVEGRVQTDGGAEQSWETEGEVKIKGTPQEKKLVEDFAEGLTTQEWKEEYRKGELPHWMTDLEPSPLSKELNDDLEKGGIKQANILEIGTGNGRDSIFLAKRGHTTTGIDVAEQAVSAAKKNAGKLKNVTFEKGNAEKLKYPDESFDAVFSIAALHSSLLDESLAEINRVLKPGGIAKIHQYTKIETAGKTIHYWKPEQIKELAKKAGFSVLESHTTTKSDFVEVEGVREKIKQDSDIIVYTIKKEGLAPAAVTQGKGEGPITKAEKNALREKGYKVSQILKMTPGQARELLLEVPAEEVAKIEKPKPTGGGTGGSSAAAASSQSTGGGYGTIASSEKSTFANTTNKKRFRDAAPDKKSLRAVDELLKGVSPASRGGARGGARVLRKNLGQLAHETTVAHEALRKAHHAFTFMSRADIYEFIDRMETGRAQSSLKLDDMAKSFRKMLDGRRDTVRGLGKGHLENFYESYFPHIWKDPASAKKAIMQIFGKRRLEGSKSFLKKRSIMTIKEGRGYGLELVSENPVDLVLLKVYEMDRYIMAQRIIQDLKARGLIKFVYSRSQSPDGYVKVNDNAFTVYMPPEITKKEAYDQILVDQLMDTARSMGIDTDRFVAIGGKRWGYAQYEGSPETGPHKIRTKYAGPESVLAHEIGHVLGYKYNLFETIRRKKDGSYRDITKGEKAGGQRFVPTKDAVTHRRTIDKEWRDLADARYKGQQVSPGYQKYVRKAREKEAVLLEALIHAPDEFKSVAPTLHGLFVKFLNSHSELRPILDMKPSLVLGQSDAKIKVPGFTTLGHYYAPEPVGKILNNYLSPGLRNSENKIIATGYNLLRMSGNILNQAQLALSLFHGLNVTTDMIASTYGMGIRQMTIKGQRLHGVGRIISSPASPLLRLWSGIRLRRAYKQQIDTITNPRLQAMVRAVVLADGRDRMDPFYYNQAIKALKGTVSDLIHGSPKQKIAGVFKLPVQTFGATLEVLAKPLMEWYVPTGKLGLFAMMAESEMKRAESGQITNEQLHERLISSWDSVDNRMGQLVYDNLFWNKTFKDVSMMAVRSVGWNLGSWREYGGVPIDILGTKGRLERGDVLLSQKMSYTIGAVTLYGVLGAAIGYILTGKPPEEPKDYFFPKTGNKNNDGSDERLSLPTYAKDWFAYGTQPVKTVKNKTHPLWGLLTDVVSNKDFFSTQIRNPKDLISQQLLDVAEYIGREFLPLSARNYEKMSTADPGKQGKNAWVSITGITSAPSYITRSPAQKLMYRYIIENIPDKTKNKEQTELYRYRRDIKNRLRKGDPVDKDEVIKRIGAKSWLQLKADARKEPFIESFSRLSLNHCLYVYAIASPAEKRAARTILKGKYSRAEKITPEMKLMYNVLMLEGAD